MDDWIHLGGKDACVIHLRPRECERERERERRTAFLPAERERERRAAFLPAERERERRVDFLWAEREREWAMKIVCFTLLQMLKNQSWLKMHFDPWAPDPKSRNSVSLPLDHSKSSQRS